MIYYDHDDRYKFDREMLGSIDYFLRGRRISYREAEEIFYMIFQHMETIDVDEIMMRITRLLAERKTEERITLEKKMQYLEHMRNITISSKEILLPKKEKEFLTEDECKID